MHQAHQDVILRDMTGSVLLRGSISLVLMIGVWTSSEAWALTADPAMVTFQAVQGTNPPSQTVILSKSGRRQRSWTVRDSASWLTISPISGSITTSAQIVLTGNVAGMAVGTYTATVRVTLKDGARTSIPVTLRVTAPPPPLPPPTSSTQALLTWGAVTSSDLAGYKVYVGTRSGVYGAPLDVGNLTSYTVKNLLVGTTYYFVVSSYSSSGSESPYSNEVSKSIY